MSLTYQYLVEQAKSFFVQKLQEWKSLPAPEDVDMLYFLASIFGLQKLVDIFNYLRESFDGGEKLSQEVFDRIKAVSIELVNAWIAPDFYGEFVKDGLIAFRPLFANAVDTGPLIRELFGIIKPNWEKRISFCLPVVVQADYPYALKIPTKLFQSPKKNTLNLLYIDWNNQPNHNWLSAINLLRKWERNGSLIYHGALEVPVDRVLERRDILPYYVVLSYSGSGEDFLRSEGVVGHALKLIAPSENGREAEYLVKEEDPSLLRMAGEVRMSRGRITSIVPTESKSENPQLSQGQVLSIIPFRVEDLSNPQFQWPRQPERVHVETGS